MDLSTACHFDIYHFWMSSFSFVRCSSSSTRLRAGSPSDKTSVLTGTASLVVNYKPCLWPNMLPVEQDLCRGTAATQPLESVIVRENECKWSCFWSLFTIWFFPLRCKVLSCICRGSLCINCVMLGCWEAIRSQQFDAGIQHCPLNSHYILFHAWWNPKNDAKFHFGKHYS